MQRKGKSTKRAKRLCPQRSWASWAGSAKAPVAWNPASLSGDRFRRRLAPRLAGFFEQLALSARPVFERISGRAIALQINMVGAQRDLFRCRTVPDCSRLSHCWRGTLPRLGHKILLSTPASILHLVESHRLRIHWRINRKIQYIESKKRLRRRERKYGRCSRRPVGPETRDAACSESEACCSKEDAPTEEKRGRMKIHEQGQRIGNSRGARWI